MIACNIAPNLNRKEFAFEKWKDWDEELFELIDTKFSFCLSFKLRFKGV